VTAPAWPTPRLERLAEEIERRLPTHDPAHDWQHVCRVAANAGLIAPAVGAGTEIVLAAALCHELFNLPKHHPEAARSGALCADHARQLLGELGWGPDETAAVATCIAVHGFATGLAAPTLEAQVLQDADRLDAIGAIGIARLFATCTTMQRPFYAPQDPFAEGRDADDQAWGLDHVYRKLLRIPERLNTPAARQLAEPRIRFLQAYLAQLRTEILPERR
jgi:uncharacterized protein